MYELKGFQPQGLFYVSKTNIINYMTCYIKVITIHAPKELNFKTSRFFFVKMIKHTLICSFCSTWQKHLLMYRIICYTEICFSAWTKGTYLPSLLMQPQSEETITAKKAISTLIEVAISYLFISFISGLSPSKCH